MAEKALIFGKAFTNSVLFTRALKEACDRGRLPGKVVYLLDSPWNAREARAVLPAEKVDVRYLYEGWDPFSPIPIDEKQLREWESRYGDPNLRPYITSERILESQPDHKRWNYLFSHIRYMERLWEEVRPDIHICGCADSLTPWVILNVCLRRGVPCRSFFPSRFGEKVFLTDNPYEHLAVGGIYRKFLREGVPPENRRSAEDWLHGYRSKNVVPFYANQHVEHPWPTPARLWRAYRRFMDDDMSYRTYSFRTILRHNLERKLAGPLVRWKLRGRIELRIPAGEKFYYFPLHFEPGAALLIMGMRHRDQGALLQAIAESLPMDSYLYVKEHPLMNPGNRGFAFYQRLLDLPRVRFLSPNIRGQDVIEASRGVMAISGTAGWEAITLKKPVFLFGRCFYDEFTEAVVRIEDLNDLPGLLKKESGPTATEEQTLAFMAAVLERTYDGLIAEPRYFPEYAGQTLSKENIGRFADLFARAMEGRLP